jgi:GH15 family glucan-1,4-alpha-glucosidase
MHGKRTRVKRRSFREYSISDYAIIGNCETAALVNSDGGIDWLCLPTFDSPSIFGALLDREKGGEFFIRPRCNYRVEREYVENSAILQTRFITEKGAVQLTDFFVIARDRHARFYDFTSLHPIRKLVRILKWKVAILSPSK